MGWISKRMMSNRAKWGKPIAKEKRRAPLRKISYVLRHRNGMFDADYVMLECGHEGYAWGSQKARCVECGSSKALSSTLVSKIAEFP